MLGDRSISLTDVGILDVFLLFTKPLPGWLTGEHVGLMTWWLRVRSSVEATFLSGVFRVSPLQKHVRKVVGGFGKKSCVSTGVRKPGNTCHRPP